MTNHHWYKSVAELAAIYGEMCAINETPRKEQTPEQTDRLNVLRNQCVAVHLKRITMNMTGQRDQSKTS